MEVHQETVDAIARLIAVCCRKCSGPAGKTSKMRHHSDGTKERGWRCRVCEAIEWRPA